MQKTRDIAPLQSPLTRIYLVGMPGSGKSTLGKRLASHLQWNFVDLDASILLQQKKSMEELFEHNGEPGFRVIEQEALHRTAHLTETVIATGGGTPAYMDNMNFMLQNGLCVYLDVKNDYLATRLMHSKTVRPMLKSLDKTQLMEWIRVKSEARNPIYRRAQVHFNPETETLESLASRAIWAK